MDVYILDRASYSDNRDIKVVVALIMSRSDLIMKEVSIWVMR